MVSVVDTFIYISHILLYSISRPRKKSTRSGASRTVNEARRLHTSSKPCALEKKERRKKARNPASPKTHHEIDSSPATATTSRRRETKHVPSVSQHWSTSIDPGFVEIGLIQLSESVQTTNVTCIHPSIHPSIHTGIHTYILTDRQTD